MGTLRLLRIVLVGLWLALLAPVTARAQPTPTPTPAQTEQARALFEEGVSAADAERWADAADRFTRSRALVERPSTLYNLLSALYRLGRYPDALLVARDYLKLSDVQTDPASRQEVERLNGEMKRAVARVQVSVDPARAIVTLDGVRVTGTKPGTYQLTLNAGSYVLRAEADGHEPHDEALKLTRGTNLRLRVALRSLAPVPVRVSDGEAPAPRPSSTDALLAEGPGTDMLNRAMNRKLRRRRALWVVGGVLVAGAIAGAVAVSASQ